MLWRARYQLSIVVQIAINAQISIDFAQILLQQCHFPSAAGLIDSARLRNLHVLELGWGNSSSQHRQFIYFFSAGTGLLGILLMPFVRHYTLTDVASLVPLIRKNLALNTDGTMGSNVSVQELDWLILQSTPANLRSRFFSFTHPADVILVVDCIYHPFLIPGLVETIDFLSVPAHTAVLIVVELRAEDVVRDFLELWMAKPNWKIWRVGRQGGLQKPYVMWVGMKTR